jgi:hypothetical protein
MRIVVIPLLLRKEVKLYDGEHIFSRKNLIILKGVLFQIKEKFQ